MEVAHPSRDGSTLTKDNRSTTRTMCRSERQRQHLLSTTEISGSCPMPRQVAGKRFKLEFPTDFAGPVMDVETGELMKYSIR